MEFDDRELARLRAIANLVISNSNRKAKWQATVQVRRTPQGAHLIVGYRSGAPKPKDPLTFLGDVADNIRNELRLEQTPTGSPIYRTSESEFTSGGDPEFTFNVTPG